MPNWVFNKVYLRGSKSRLKEFRDYMTTDKNAFDFNRLIPMPKELDIISGSDEKVAVACAKAKRSGKNTCAEFEKPYASHKTFEEYAELGERYLSNIEKYGCSTWYDWCCNHWGTKWNACDAVWNGDDFISFNTAWSAPLPIYEQMTKQFPDILFSVDYADEDLGNNCGTVSWDEEGCFNWFVEDSFEFACDVWGYDPNEFADEEECVYE